MDAVDLLEQLSDGTYDLMSVMPLPRYDRAVADEHRTARKRATGVLEPAATRADQPLTGTGGDDLGHDQPVRPEGRAGRCRRATGTLTPRSPLTELSCAPPRDAPRTGVLDGARPPHRRLSGDAPRRRASRWCRRSWGTPTT